MIDNNDIENLINSGNTDKQKVNGFLNNLKPDEKRKLESIMNDKQKLNELLNSDIAKSLMKKFGKDNG